MDRLAEFPRNMTEFEERFATEAACLAFARKAKWPSGFRCRRCPSEVSWPVANGRRDECRWCGHQESVTSGTLFHQTKKPLRLWFRAITLWVTSKRGLSAMEMSRQLGIHYETAWTWCHKLRASVGAVFGKDKLSGVVEMDETYLGGTDDRAHKGRSLAGKKALVVGAVEVQPTQTPRRIRLGRARLEMAAAATGENLTDFAVRNIEQHAGARTDGLAAYNGLVDAGIGHQQIVIGKDAGATSMSQVDDRPGSALRVAPWSPATGLTLASAGRACASALRCSPSQSSPAAPTAESEIRAPRRSPAPVRSPATRRSPAGIAPRPATPWGARTSASAGRI